MGLFWRSLGLFFHRRDSGPYNICFQYEGSGAGRHADEQILLGFFLLFSFWIIYIKPFLHFNGSGKFE